MQLFICFSKNHLRSFPKSVCGLPQLDVLDISNNEIKIIPPEVKSLQTVELNLNQNQVSLIFLRF